MRERAYYLSVFYNLSYFIQFISEKVGLAVDSVKLAVFGYNYKIPKTIDFEIEKRPVKTKFIEFMAARGKSVARRIKNYFWQYRLSYSKLITSLMYALIFIFLGYLAIVSYVFKVEGKNGIRAVGILTRSMYPAIKPGSLVVTKANKDYAIGSVVTYQLVSQSGEKLPLTFTHRLVETVDEGNSRYFIAKGDNNSVPDPYKITADQILGEVVMAIPLIGYVYASIKTLPGFLGIVAIPFVSLVKEQINYIRQDY